MTHTAPQRWLAVDHGEKRIGLALGNTADRIASPLEVISAQPPQAALARIVELAGQYSAAGIVVGLPLNMDGTEGPQALLARDLAVRLSQTGGLDVRLWDERLTSFAADQAIAGRFTRKGRRQRQDAYAAAAILQDFFAGDGPNKAPAPGLRESALEIEPSAMCGRIIEEMKAVFDGDTRRIDHAMKVLGFARQLLVREQADRDVVEAAAVLHDIGIHAAQAKYKSAAGKYQEIEGPPIAREILGRLGFDGQATEHVCRIIANHHSARDIDTPEFRIIWDADWLVNLPEEYAGWASLEPQARQRVVERLFRTRTGRELAAAIHVRP